VEIPLADHVNKSDSCLGAKVPGNESFTYGTFTPGSESTWERKFCNSLRTLWPGRLFIRHTAVLCQNGAS